MANFLAQPSEEDMAARREAARAKLGQIEQSSAAKDKAQVGTAGGALGALIGGIAGGYFGGPAGAAKGATQGYSIGSTVGGAASDVYHGDMGGVKDLATGGIGALNLGKDLKAMKEGKLQDALLDEELKKKLLEGNTTEPVSGSTFSAGSK